MSTKRNAFMECHPIVQFLYFAAVITVTMLVDHPVILGVSFLGAFLYSAQIYGVGKLMKTQLSIAVPLIFFVILINGLFNHYGVTVLYYIRTGAVTLESLVYGIVLAFMLWTAIIWFSAVNKVLTTDRMIYLFGRIVPFFSLVLSMVLRFVPRFTKQYTVIRESRRGLGIDGSGKGALWKVKNALQEFSILMTWSMEKGIDTADSMRARGYGMKKRTFYEVFWLCRRDYISLAVLLILYAVCLAGFWNGYAYANYNPRIIVTGLSLRWQDIWCYLAWGAFCMFPVTISFVD